MNKNKEKYITVENYHHEFGWLLNKEIKKYLDKYNYDYSESMQSTSIYVNRDDKKQIRIADHPNRNSRELINIRWTKPEMEATASEEYEQQIACENNIEIPTCHYEAEESNHDEVIAELIDKKPNIEYYEGKYYERFTASELDHSVYEEVNGIIEQLILLGVVR